MQTPTAPVRAPARKTPEEYRQNLFDMPVSGPATFRILRLADNVVRTATRVADVPRERFASVAALEAHIKTLGPGSYQVKLLNSLQLVCATASFDRVTVQAPAPAPVAAPVVEKVVPKAPELPLVVEPTR